MRSNSSQHTSEDPESPADSRRQQRQQQWRRQQQQQQLSSEHSQEDVISEEAQLLSAKAERTRCNGGSSSSVCIRPVKLAWQPSSSGPTTGASLEDHSGDESGSGSESGQDVRLQHIGRSAVNSNGSSWLLSARRRQQQLSSPRVAQVDFSAQTSPTSAGSQSLKLRLAPGSSWTLGGQSHVFSSTAATHTVVEDFSGQQSNSRSTVGVAEGEAATASRLLGIARQHVGSGPTTSLGPGTHKIGHGGQLPSLIREAGLAAATASLVSTGAALQGARRLQAKLPVGNAAACESDDEPPSLKARIAEKQQQQALAGMASHSRSSSSGGSSGSTQAAVPAAAAAAAKAHVPNKKKKGKGKADAAESRTAAEARAAAEARRRDRDCVEYALLDNRGTSSKIESEVSDDLPCWAVGHSVSMTVRIPFWLLVIQCWCLLALVLCLSALLVQHCDVHAQVHDPPPVDPQTLLYLVD
jgi:hypothetical protein